MKYRINKRTGDRISEIGMGTAYIVEAPKKEAVRTVRRAYEEGINYFDLAAGHFYSLPFLNMKNRSVQGILFRCPAAGYMG